MNKESKREFFSSSSPVRCCPSLSRPGLSPLPHSPQLLSPSTPFAKTWSISCSLRYGCTSLAFEASTNTSTLARSLHAVLPSTTLIMPATSGKAISTHLGLRSEQPQIQALSGSLRSYGENCCAMCGAREPGEAESLCGRGFRSEFRCRFGRRLRAELELSAFFKIATWQRHRGEETLRMERDLERGACRQREEHSKGGR